MKKQKWEKSSKEISYEKTTSKLMIIKVKHVVKNQNST